MSKWIKADAVNVEIGGGYIDIDAESFLNAPSIDIVHCFECKYAHITYDGQCKYCDQITDDDGNVIEVYYDGSHFCSYGVKKGANDEKLVQSSERR